MSSSPSTLIEVAPLAAGEPLPHRKILRTWITPFADKSTLRALALLAFDYAVWLGLIAITVWAPSILVKVIAGNVAGFWIGRLFILGHDACHQSFTPHRGLNKILGRIAFLPSVTPYSVWEIGHNVVHHGQTNLKGFDTIWVPLSVKEYAALDPTARRIERLYRNGWGVGLYYMVEMWWNKMFFPNRRHLPPRRPSVFWDSVLVARFVGIWAAALVTAAVVTEQSAWLLLLCGLVIPFLFWNAMIGFVVYLHHTHPQVRWYDNKSEWTRAQPFVSTTVHLRCGWLFDRLLHQIMEHTAHHVDMGIPLYNLKAAQSRLEELLPGRIVIEHFSWRRYFEIARLCKLYDFERKRWLDFDGRETPGQDLAAAANA